MVTQSFSPKTTISFSSLGEEDGTEGPMIIEAKIGGHFIHRIYVDIRWELANVCGFQRSKQSMSLGWLSLAGDRLE
ncbi:hypothetical protein Tco_0486071, partial [Tanacetum coccineum]